MNLNYKTFGSGDPIIILHGLFGSLDNWQTIAKQLAETHSVYLVDQRNHGKSPHNDQHSYELMAEDLRAFMESQWIYEATIIGHSMGGKTAMQFAFNNPDMVEKLVIVDITAKGSKGEHEAIFDAFFSLDLNKLTSRKEAQDFFESKLDQVDVVQFLLKNLARKKEGGFAWKMNLPVLHETYAEIMGSLELEGQFEAPTLFIRGAKSQYVSDQDFVQLQQKFTDAKLVTIADAGHWIHAEQPKDFLKELTIFLNN